MFKAYNQTSQSIFADGVIFPPYEVVDIASITPIIQGHAQRGSLVIHRVGKEVPDGSTEKSEAPKG